MMAQSGPPSFPRDRAGRTDCGNGLARSAQGPPVVPSAAATAAPKDVDELAVASKRRVVASHPSLGRDACLHGGQVAQAVRVSAAAALSYGQATDHPPVRNGRFFPPPPRV